MKNLFLTLALIATFFTGKAQEKEYSIYVPLQTYHLDRRANVLSHYVDGEGGNIGAILNITTRMEGIYLRELSTGVFRNSFGRPALIIQQNFGLEKNNIKAMFGMGIATGYHLDSGFHNYDRLPKVMRNSGILPTANVSIVYTKYRIRPTLVISPFFVNGGVTISLKK